MTKGSLGERLVQLSGVLDRSAQTARLAMVRLDDLERFVAVVAACRTNEDFAQAHVLAVDLQGKTYGDT